MQHGFDLTHFGDQWPKFATMLDLHFVGRCRNGTAFEWASEGGAVIVTQNNPDTGEYGPGREMRDDEPGFASYIGIEGPPQAVEEAVKLVHQCAEYIKGESPGRREFI